MPWESLKLWWLLTQLTKDKGLVKKDDSVPFLNFISSEMNGPNDPCKQPTFMGFFFTCFAVQLMIQKLFGIFKRGHIKGMCHFNCLLYKRLSLLSAYPPIKCQITQPSKCFVTCLFPKMFLWASRLHDCKANQCFYSLYSGHLLPQVVFSRKAFHISTVQTHTCTNNRDKFEHSNESQQKTDYWKSLKDLPEWFSCGVGFFFVSSIPFWSQQSEMFNLFNLHVRFKCTIVRHLVWGRRLIIIYRWRYYCRVMCCVGQLWHHTL